MSDCIRKSALIEELRKGQEVIKDKLDDISISGIYATIEAVIEEIDRQPTLDEKEIIRKGFERVIKRICNVRNNTPSTEFKNGCNACLVEIHKYIDSDVKEEGGIE
jgi:hypothetical protein